MYFVVCCMLDIAALCMVHVACRHERATCCAIHDLRCCTLYAVSWRALLRAAPRVPYVSRHVLLVVCCKLERRMPRGRFLHVGVICCSRCGVSCTASGADHTGGRCRRARALRPMAVPEGAAGAPMQRHGPPPLPLLVACSKTA
jgi:hypothetical protein